MIGRALASVMRGYIYNTPAHPGRGIIGKIAHQLDPRPIIHEVAPGAKLKLSMANGDHIFLWCNKYEEHGELEVFTGLIQPGMTVFDIGANIGMYSCAAAYKVGPTGRVFAFEPMPEVYELLKESIAFNEAKNISAHCLALSDKAGTATFHVGTSDSIGSLVRPTGLSKTVTVTTITMDQFLAEQKIDRVDAIKIDVEGAEPLVIRGMHGLLSRPDKPLMLVEHNHSALNAAGFSAEELFARIMAYGYQANAILDRKLVPVPGLIEPSHRYTEPTMNYIFLPK